MWLTGDQNGMMLLFLLCVTTCKALLQPDKLEMHPTGQNYFLLSSGHIEGLDAGYEYERFVPTFCKKHV